MRILYLQPGRGIGGAKVSLSYLLQTTPDAQSSQLVLSPPAEDIFTEMLGQQVEKIHTLYLPTWNKSLGRSAGWHLLSFLVRLARGWYVWPAIQLAKILISERIDLVHTNSSICPVGAQAAWLTRRPHVWHVRERIGSDGLFLLKTGDRLSALLFKHLSNVIICNSEYTAEFFRRYGVKPKVIRNGIQLDAFANSKERGIALRRELGLRNDLPLIGMVGSVRSKIKKHDVFLQAMAAVRNQVPDIQFVIFGGTSNPDASSYTREMHDTADRLKIADNVVWADFIEDVPAIMHSMDIMVHPTSKEGSGRVVMEAMAAGKTVVAVRSGGVQELVQDGQTGYLVSPGDWISLAEATQRLLEQPGLRREMGECAKVYAKVHFSHENTAVTIQNLYQSLLSP